MDENKGGRPAIADEEQRRVNTTMRLPRWLLAWLDTREESRGTLVEEALKKVHKLKKPGA